MLDETMMYSCAIFPRAGLLAARSAGREARRHLPQARAHPAGPPGRDRHRLGRPRDPRRHELRLPRDHHHHLPRAARLREGEDRAARPRQPHHPAVPGLSRSHGPVRQARLDRDDRSGRARTSSRPIFAKCASLLKPDGLDAAAGDHDPGPVLRAGAGLGRLHPALHFPGQLHSVGHRDHRCGRARPRT